ncbi:MAG TPA: GAF domain-containing protein [Planctomycetaceae bacterium]|jgi:multidrug efflux pump subunit AcrA (membrane-fusion protein)|nr:GAF domain-containing protein [Planctomycetaceae bacterium]
MTNVASIQQARDRVLQMARQIEELSQTAAPPETFFPEFLRLLVSSLGARAGAIWMLDGASRLRLAHELRFAEIGIRENSPAAGLNDKLLNEALSTGQAVSLAPDDPNSANRVPAAFLVLVAALQVGEESLGVVEIFQRSDAPRDARPGFLQFVEQMVGHASRYLERQQADRQPQDAASFLTDFEQFLLQLQRGEDVEEVATTAANDGRQLLGCDRLSVAIHKGAKTSIVAISGQDSVNARANLTRAMAQIAERVIELREPLTFSGKIDELPPQIERPLADFVQESGSRMVKLLPLIEPEPLISRRDDEHRRKAPPRPRETLGCLVIEQTSESRPRLTVEARSALLAEHVSSVLNRARQNDRILFLRLWQTLGHGVEWFHGRRLAKTLAALAALVIVVAALWFVPYDYRVTGKGKLMPVRRHQIFAPENGDVIQLFVRGGDKVKKGQPLLQLRNEQLAADLNENLSKLEQAAQQALSSGAESDLARNEGDKQGTLKTSMARRKAQIEMEGLTDIIKIQQERVDKLLLKAPMDGRIASFQLEETLQNRPVQQGELLLEDMDETGPWRLELEVEGSRMGHVLRAWKASPDHKLDVEFIPATALESTFDATLDSISPRSAVSSDQSNIFEMYASTDASKIPDLWIGAEVRAKINCGRRSLGYVLFGDVVEFIRQKLWL